MAIPARGPDPRFLLRRDDTVACLNRMIISDYEFGQFWISICVILKPKEIDMAKGQQRSNREAKKPKKKKIKVIAAAPSQKGAGWQPTFAEGKKK
ncbi:hypothetical protein [Bradyrhizobium sp. Leo121]|uniref:hypothetical protein n=1 Tax=Bradyrhizobium sp. Leo121 TaxID=1571195 RepID=UPI0010291126|nr:hypothetical protein [Bradyrhizobium sp. Leo121]RZN27179.1 hypothetical protein CWO90_25270 [Bradyrhizobium sp. Leo121]